MYQSIRQLQEEIERLKRDNDLLGKQVVSWCRTKELDQAEIERLHAELKRSSVEVVAAHALLRGMKAENERHVEALQDKINAHDCACSYDHPEDVCMTHSPTVERLTATLREIAEHTHCDLGPFCRDIARAELEKKP